MQLHSDQGFQYTSHACFQLTQSYGLTPSMSRRGNPYDNAMAEISSPSSKLSASTGISLLHSAKQTISLIAISTSTTMSASSSKLACLRSRFGTPVDLAFLHPGFFVQSVHLGAVQSIMLRGLHFAYEQLSYYNVLVTSSFSSTAPKYSSTSALVSFMAFFSSSGIFLGRTRA